jgi:hypothetical protein
LCKFYGQIEPLTNKEKRAFIEKYLEQYSKKLSHDQIFLLVESKQCSIPLFLRSILEQLRTFGDYERLTDIINHFLRAPDLATLFQEVCSLYHIQLIS